MIIPISEIAAWIGFIFLSYILGFGSYCFFKYPNDPTIKGLITSSVIWFLILVGAYATKQGWIIWK